MNGFYHLETGRCGGSLFELSRAVDRSPIAAAQLDRPIVRDAAAARQRGDAGHAGGLPGISGHPAGMCPPYAAGAQRRL